jgi:predicted AAA+ superfamily ATPase
LKDGLFDFAELPGQLSDQLREVNPWWQGKPGRQLPAYKRAAYQTLERKLSAGLAPAVVIRGPRQVGKTTLQEQLIESLLARGISAHAILRVQFDDLPTLRKLNEPILSLGRWFQKNVLGQTFNEAARKKRPAYIFLDKVQNLRDWASQVKSLVDHSEVKVVITGSSALRIELGRDSLAGRITTIDLGPFLLREIAGLRLQSEVPPYLPANGLEPMLRLDFWRGLVDFGKTHAQVRDAAFRLFSERGGYPIAHSKPEPPWAEIADQLNETIVQRVIQHDLRIGQRGKKRDQHLLEELFRLVSRYCGQAPGQAVYVQELRGALGANIGWQRVLNYLKFLDGSLLLKLILPLELRLKRRKGNPKLALCDHGVRASWLQEVIPLSPEELEQKGHLADLAGHIAESVLGYFLSGISGLDLAHFPARGAEPEVDYIMMVGDRRIPIEVKYRRHIDPHQDTLGLRAFIEKTVYNAPFGLLITRTDDIDIPDPRILPIPLRTFLLLR